jgi:phosphate transport system protein
MREEFRLQLAIVSEHLSAMAETTGKAMQSATRGLLEQDRAAAEGVLDDEREIDALRSRVEEASYELLALQAPVASDLRVVVTAQHTATDLSRMGHLAGHVARTALRRYPDSAVVPELTEVFAGMAQVAGHMADKMVAVISHRDAALATQLDTDDDEMDALHGRMFTILFGADWRRGAEAAVDAALLGRYYERFADHCVNAAAQVIYLVTGEYAAG